MPNIATWWCGQTASGSDACSTISTAWRIARRLRRQPLPALRMASRRSARRPRRRGARAELRERDRRRGRSTSSARRWCSSRPCRSGRTASSSRALSCCASLRPRRRDGWEIMPGGFCRISDRLDARAISHGRRRAVRRCLGARRQAGGSRRRCCPRATTVQIRRILGNLPSRAADNLFWLGRYLERAEATLRVVRVPAAASDATRRGRQAPGDVGRRRCQAVERLRRMLVAWGAVPGGRQDAADAADRRHALHDDERTTARRSPSCARRARAASVMRERLSADAWQLSAPSSKSRLVRRRRHEPLREPSCSSAPTARCSVIAALSGLAQENMNRGRRLALPRYRAAHRARHQHLPASRRISRPTTRQSTTSTSCST